MRYAAVVPLVLGFVAACGDAGPLKEPTGPGQPPVLERVVSGGADITLKAATQRVPADLVSTALSSVDTAAQTYVFDAAVLSQGGIEFTSGGILWIDGVALRRITSVSTASGAVTVSTADALLTDAIEEGTIAWDEPLAFTAETLGSAQVVKPDGSLVQARSVSANGAVKFQYTVGDYSYELDIQPQNGPAQIRIEVKKTSQQRVTSRFTFGGSISQGNASGQVVIKNGQTERFDYKNSAVQGTIDLDFAIAGDSAKDFSFKYPEPFIRFPIQVGPVPILVTLKLQVATRISVPLAFQASATLNTKFSYSGDTGFEFAGGSFKNTSTMPAPTLGPSLADAGALIGGPVDAQIRLGVPRAEFGLFGNTIVPFVRVELFAGTQLYWGPICKTAKIEYMVTAGADLRFLGKPLAKFPEDTLVGPHTLTPSDQCTGSDVLDRIVF